MNATLDYSKRFINANFRLKVYGHTNEGHKINSLMGVSGLLRLIDAALFNKFIERALRDGMDKQVCKLRRGLVVTLYAK